MALHEINIQKIGLGKSHVYKDLQNGLFHTFCVKPCRKRPHLYTLTKTALHKPSESIENRGKQLAFHPRFHIFIATLHTAFAKSYAMENFCTKVEKFIKASCSDKSYVQRQWKKIYVLLILN